MFGLIKKIFIGSLSSSIVHAFNLTKCVFLSNQKCEIQPTLTNFHPNEYSQEFHCYPFLVKLDRCVGSYPINDLPNKVCVPNETDDLNLSFFNMITGINESKTLIKDILCECKCKLDGRKCNLNQRWNNGQFGCECKKKMYLKKVMFRILLHVTVKMEYI